MKNSICLAALLAATPAVAAPQCNLSVPALTFGAHDYAIGRTHDISTTLTLSCSCAAGDTLHYRIALSAGLGEMGMRQMRSGSERLDFNLFIDAARTQPWGDGSGGSHTVAGGPLACSTAIALHHTIYGRVFASAQVVPGWYLDSTIVATVSWNE